MPFPKPRFVPLVARDLDLEMPLENVGREQSDSRKPYHGMGAAGSGLSFCHGEGAQAPLWVWGLVQVTLKTLHSSEAQLLLSNML